MKTVVNKSGRRLGFPSGVALLDGETGAIDDKDVEHPVVVAWLAGGMIEIQPEAPAPEAPAPKDQKAKG